MERIRMKEKIIDSHFTAFWGVFLTLGCNLRCDYCVQKISLPLRPPASYSPQSGPMWTAALNAIANRTQKRFLRRRRIKKLSILGGEPTIFPDFLYVLNNLDKNWKITVTSNFDSPFFSHPDKLRQIKHKSRLRFNGSLHFLHTPWERFAANVRRLQKAGISVHTLFVVAHPGHLDKVLEYKKKLLRIHPRVKLQRFFGVYKNNLYPREDDYGLAEEQIDGIDDYHLYRQGFSQKNASSVLCHSDKALIAPNGDIYNCHYKLYTGHKDKLGNLFAADVHARVPRDYFPCGEFGFCNPCDSEGHLFKTVDGQIKSM